MGSRWGNDDAPGPRPVKDPAPMGGPGPTRHNRSDIPRWQVWFVGVLVFVLVGVPIFILWAKAILWMLGL